MIAMVSVSPTKFTTAFPTAPLLLRIFCKAMLPLACALFCGDANRSIIAKFRWNLKKFDYQQIYEDF